MTQPMTTTTNEAWIPDDTFGSRLAQLRQGKRLNITRAAELAGINAESWRLWEQRGRSPRDLEHVAHQIAERLGVDYVWLMTGVRTGSSSTLDGIPGQGCLDLALGA